MNVGPRVVVKDVHKEFVLRDHGAASLKTYILWWRRKKRPRIREVREILKGISFHVNSGECVAVIGRNGAGKSTLLAILARVYRATSGSVEIRGRVAPLLELGAGFHPDLSGRDNVEFNGVLLGLTHKQVIERMDSIIAFAELEEYIDLPIRTYSSGMAARLGFSVAMHVDADILLVDEALSVGDFIFVEKCIKRIEEFKVNGGTVLFVSHSFEAVASLADRCVYIEHGVVVADGDPEEVIEKYKHEAPVALEGV